MNVDGTSPGPWHLKALTVKTATGQPAEADIVLVGDDGKEVQQSATGDGPIAAASQAIENITGIALTLKNFELHSASMGEDAQGEVTVTVEHDGESYRGRGTSVDIVEAGSQACLEVSNRVLRRRERGTVPTQSTVDRATI